MEDIILLSDRGTAVLSALNQNYDKPFKKPCPKHLEGNLKAKSFRPELISLYWKASNAKTKIQFDLVIEMILATPNGISIYLLFYIIIIYNCVLCRK